MKKPASPKVPKMSDADLLAAGKALSKMYRTAIRDGKAELDPNALRKLEGAIKSMEARQ